LTASETIEVNEVDSATVEMSEQEAKTILPIGPLTVFTPHGLQFAVPVSLVLKYTPSQMPQGHVSYVFYYNETSAPPRWEKMGGTIVGAGLLETKTMHFSTFGVMAVQPEPPAATGSPPASTPNPIQSVLPAPSTTPAVVDPDSGISVALVASLIAAGVTVILACLICACFEQRRRTQEREDGFAKTQRSYSHPSLLQPHNDMCIDANITVQNAGSRTSSTRPEPDDDQLRDEEHGKPKTRLPSMWAPPKSSSSRGAVALWMPPSATTAAALSVPARVGGPPKNPLVAGLITSVHEENEEEAGKEVSSAKISQPPASSVYPPLSGRGLTQPSSIHLVMPRPPSPAKSTSSEEALFVLKPSPRPNSRPESFSPVSKTLSTAEPLSRNTRADSLNISQIPGLAPFTDIPGLEDEDEKEYARGSEDEKEYLF
jgi:hypothetical protein